MITAVSANPCADLTVYIDRLEPGGTHVVKGTRTDIGSKGVNVCAALRGLGAQARCLLLRHEDDGDAVTGFLDARGIEHREITVPGSLRCNIKLTESDGTMTEFNSRGRRVGEEDAQAFLRLCLGAMEDCEIMALSGSTAPGFPPEFYATLIAQANFLGVRTLLDAGGEALREGIAALPYIVKPNKAELESLLGRRLGSVGEVAAAARELAEQIPYVFVSLGAEGAVAAGGRYAYFAENLPVAVRGAAGAGDCMAAGICLAASGDEPIEKMLALGSAAAQSAVSKPGTEVCGADAYELLGRIRVFRI